MKTSSSGQSQKLLLLLWVTSSVLCQDLLIQPVDAARLEAVRGLNAGVVTPSGEVVALSVTNRKLYRFSSQAQPRSWNVAGMPELEYAVRPPSLMPSLALGPDGHILVPAVWSRETSGGRRFQSGAFVFSSGGAYERTLLFEPPVEARRLVRDESGNFFVSGVDGAYFRSLTGGCYLLHKYSPDGNRLGSFSECPDNEGGRLRSSMTEMKRLMREMDHSHLWHRGGELVQVLALSRLVRTFDAGGRLMREVILEPPDESRILTKPFPLPVPVTERLVFGAFALPGQGWLIHWMLTAGGYRRGYLSVHRFDGRAASNAKVLPKLAPVAVDPVGYVLFAGPAEKSGSIELVRASVSVR
jgi:hypothetical protein